jgi:hypothetical protein
LLAAAAGFTPGAAGAADGRVAAKGISRNRRPKNPGADRRRLGGTSGLSILREENMMAAVQSYRKFVHQA